MTRTLTATVTAVLLSLLALPLGVAALTGSVAATACPTATATGTTSADVTPTPAGTAVSSPVVWDGEQLTTVAVTAGGAPAVPASVQNLLGTPDCLLGAGDALPDIAVEALPAGYSLPADVSPAVRTAITWALAQLDTPYAYGGDCTAPHSGNPAHQCDCSSLVQQAYAHAGIRLPRTTTDQVHAGQPVASPSQLRAGDLVFIPGAHGTRTRPGHVGLYLGNGLIIQAPHTGATVQITALSRWTRITAAIRRVTPA